MPNWYEINRCLIWKVLGVIECSYCGGEKECWSEDTQCKVDCKDCPYPCNSRKGQLPENLEPIEEIEVFDTRDKKGTNQRRNRKLAELTCQWCDKVFTHEGIYPEDIKKFGKGGAVLCPHCTRFTNPNPEHWGKGYTKNG